MPARELSELGANGSKLADRAAMPTAHAELRVYGGHVGRTLDHCFSWALMHARAASIAAADINGDGIGHGRGAAPYTGRLPMAVNKQPAS